MHHPPAAALRPALDDRQPSPSAPRYDPSPPKDARQSPARGMQWGPELKSTSEFVDDAPFASPSPGGRWPTTSRWASLVPWPRDLLRAYPIEEREPVQRRRVAAQGPEREF